MCLVNIAQQFPRWLVKAVHSPQYTRLYSNNTSVAHGFRGLIFSGAFAEKSSSDNHMVPPLCGRVRHANDCAVSCGPSASKGQASGVRVLTRIWKIGGSAMPR